MVSHISRVVVAAPLARAGATPTRPTDKMSVPRVFREPNQPTILSKIDIFVRAKYNVMISR